MESDVTESASFYKAWAWFETNKKNVLVGASLALVVGLIVWFFVWRANEAQITAGEALSGVFIPQATGAVKGDSAEAFLKVANQYPNSRAGARALLLAAGNFFASGKYSEAQTEFSKFIRAYPQSPFLGEALLGVAASLDAQGKSDQAIAAYKDLVDHRPGENVVPQAKFALARLYEAQGKNELARNLYEDVAKGDPNSTLSSEAGIRVEELKIKFPALASNSFSVVQPERTLGTASNATLQLNQATPAPGNATPGTKK